MSKAIFKYPVTLTQTNHIRLSGPIVHAAIAPGTSMIALWAEVGVHGGRERTFQVFGTGHEIPDAAEYIATVFDGIFVWHIYETEATR